MWNGDGKPIIWAFRVDFIQKFSKRHPDRVLGLRDGFFQMYDCLENDPQEDLDCWYCDECHSLAVFVDSEHIRFDFEMMTETPAVMESDVADWTEYIALRDKEFETYMDFYEGMRPDEAVEKYRFRYKYRVSPDKKLIYAFDEGGTFQFGFSQKRLLRLEP